MKEEELHGEETIIDMRMRKEIGTLRKDDVMSMMKEIVTEGTKEEAAMIDTLTETVSQKEEMRTITQLDDLYHLYPVMMLET